MGSTLAAAPSAAVLLNASSKCGVVVSGKNEGGGPGFTPQMLRSGVANGLAWHTNWGPHRLQPGFALEDYGGVRLVPQLWGKVDENLAPVEKPLASVLLGFNEPDQSVDGGSGVAVPAALDMWMQGVQMARARGYTAFVAPSIAQALPDRYTDKGPGNEWLPSFLLGCLERTGCKETVDFLGFHLYEPRCPTNAAIVYEWSMQARVGSLRKLMYEFNARGMNIRGLWLTEFAGRSDEQGLCRTRAQQRAWMEVILPMLNADPYVVAYSWFSYGEGRSPYFQDDANLWDYGTNELNELGRAYFHICSAVSAPTAPPWIPKRHWWRRWWIVVLFAMVAMACGLSFLLWRKLRRRKKGATASSAHSRGSSGRPPQAESCLGALASMPGCSFLLQGRGAVTPGETVVPDHSSEESEDSPELAEVADHASNQQLQPELKEAVAASRGCVASRQLFENECEVAFSHLRRGLLALPSQSGSRGQDRVRGGGRGGPPGVGPDPRSRASLADVPYKAELWEFLLRVAERRPSRRKQAEELASHLEASPPWAQVLKRRAELRQRRANLLPGRGAR